MEGCGTKGSIFRGNYFDRQSVSLDTVFDADSENRIHSG